MGFFSRRRPLNLPPLVEPPKAGEPIEFDEEEQAAIDKEIEYQYRTFYKDKVFPKEVAQQISDMYGEIALHDLAKRRLSRRDFRGAASTCIKLLGLTSQKAMQPSYWLLLAEIHAEYGDMVRAESLVKTAKEKHKMNPILSEAVWKESVRRIEDIIKSKQKR